jgi:hypothetical protein
MNGRPFLTVTTRTGTRTHLAVSSPLIPGHSPDRLPASTLCGHDVAERSNDPVHDVECLHCLFTAPHYMTWPGFGAHP